MKLLSPGHIIRMFILGIFLSCMSTSLFAQGITVSGTITGSDDGMPLPGVSVFAKNSATGTITDLDGKYIISVQDMSEILMFRFMGMKTIEKPITGEIVDIVLEPDLMGMEEVIVIGYGTKKKGNVTGSVRTVGSEKLEQIPVASFDQMLQGQASGVQSMSTSGRPGAPATVRIRGVNSVNAGNAPLYIVDNVPLSAGDFSTINPNDIQSINILKDASLTSIYGARAANGVILVTTRRGKSMEKTEFLFRNQIGMSTLARDNFSMMNTTQKLDYEEALGIRKTGTYNRDSLEAINTNWKDVMFRDAWLQSHELSARGGSDRTQFYTSGSYYKQEGILPRSDFNRYTFKLNLDHSASDRLKTGTYLTMGYEQNSNTVADGGYGNNIYNPVFAAYLLNPYTAPYDENGEFTSKGLPFPNPLEQLELNESTNSYLKIIGNVFAEYKLWKELKFRTDLGGDFSDYTGYSYINPLSAWGQSDDGSVSNSFSRSVHLKWTNLLSYSHDFGMMHKLTALVGQESVHMKSSGFNVSAKGMPNEKVRVIGVASEADDWGGSASEYTVASYFASANYIYDYKYFLDVSVRRDGSSRFGENSKWANFYSAGFQWNILKESFIPEIPVLSTLKLTASAGTLGNYNIGNYQWRSLYGYGADYNNENGSYPATAGNPDLTWETNLKTNFGIEAGFANRVNAKLEYYYNRTSDMLFLVPYSWTSGFNSKWENVGTMHNTGMDLDVDAFIIRSKDFFWQFTTSVSYNRNQVDQLYGDIEEIDQGNTILREGLPVGTYYMTRYAGVNPANGNPMWLTADGELTDTYSESNKVPILGKSHIAPWSGGITNAFVYRGLTLSVFVSWVKDRYMLNNTRYFTESNGQFASYNQTTHMQEYWKEVGDVTDVPDPTAGQAYFDTRLLEDASFLRLKNLSLSYELPGGVLSKLRYFRRIKIYAQAQNLFTLTSYQGFDPEYYGSVELNAYPQVKSFTLGLDIGF